MEKLKVLGVSKSFDGESVIQDIHIELQEGELVSLLGISGGGKKMCIRDRYRRGRCF